MSWFGAGVGFGVGLIGLGVSNLWFIGQIVLFCLCRIGSEGP